MIVRTMHGGYGCGVRAAGMLCAEGDAMKNILRLVGMVMCGVLLGGCATPPAQKPFTNFAAATRSLEAGTDQVLAGLATRVDERYMQRVAADPALAAKMRLKHAPVTGSDGAGNLMLLDGAADAPYPIKAAAFRAGVLGFNRGLAAYADALTRLADPGVVDDTGLDAIARDVNSGIAGAAGSLKVEFERDDLAIVSAGAVEILRAYLRSRQRGELVRALRAMDAKLPAVARAGQEACQIAALALWNEYDLQCGEWQRKIVARGPSESITPEVSGLVALNARHAANLAALGALHAAYGALPGAHAGLIAAAEGGGTDLAAVGGLMSEVQRLHALYESLKKEP